MLTLLALLGCRPAVSHPPRVVIVVVDGVRVDECIRADTSPLSQRSGQAAWPHIFNELVPEGTLLTGVRNLGTTITAPAHAVLATGARTPLANFAIDYGPALYRPELPTLFEELSLQTGAAGMLMANQELVEPVTWSLMPGYGEELGGDWFFVPIAPGEEQPSAADEPVFPALMRALADPDGPRLVVVNLKAVDRTGHYAALEDHLAAIAAVDAPLAQIWKLLAEQGDASLVITSDHGRHRSGSGEFWRDHGDSSAGDREIPVLMLGPQVRRGKVVDTPYALEDLAPTVAALMGISLPWAEGLPMTDALSVFVDAPARRGVAALAVDGDWELQQVWREDPAHRSAILFRGEQLSSAEALAAEAPVVVDDGARAFACWRELHERGESLPWEPRCALLEASGVRELGGPEEEVQSSWRPQLQVEDGALWLAYAHNPLGIAQLGNLEEVGPRLARWSGSWERFEDGTPALLYPAYVQRAGDSVVFLASASGNLAREERRLYVQDAAFESPPRLVETPRVQPVRGGWRVERPALRRDGEALELLAVGVGEEERLVFRLRSEDGGESWEEEILSRDAGIPVHLGPVWAGDQPVWVQGESLCSPRDCTELGRIRELAWDGQALRAVVESEPGLWSVQALQVP